MVTVFLRRKFTSQSATLALAPLTPELGRSLWENGSTLPGTLAFLAPALLALFSAVALGSLIRATRPVEAIFSFFAWICAVALGLFALGADYLATILLMVYAGAVLIFFVFVLFTVDPRWFGDSGRRPPLGLALAVAAVTLALASGSLPPLASGAVPFLPAPAALATPSLGHPGYGDLGLAFFGQYWLATTVLALILLLVLVVTIALLNRGGPRRRPALGTLLVPVSGPSSAGRLLPLAALALPGASLSLYLSLALALAVLLALGPRAPQFLFLLLCLEGATLAVIQALAAAAAGVASAEGSLLALYQVALSAAEAALALAIYLALRAGATALASSVTAFPRPSAARSALAGR